MARFIASNQRWDQLAFNMARGVILLAVILVVVSCGRRPYVATANEEIYGTWTSKTASYHKVVMHADGTWEKYIYEADAKPVYKGLYQIVDKWIDAQGNIWYKQQAQCTFGTRKGVKTQELDRIDRTGRTWELNFNFYFTRIDPKNYPTQIDPEEYSYAIYQHINN